MIHPTPNVLSRTFPRPTLPHLPIPLSLAGTSVDRRLIYKAINLMDNEGSSGSSGSNGGGQGHDRKISQQVRMVVMVMMLMLMLMMIIMMIE